MKFFSLSWFKSNKEKELEALKVEEQQLKNDILRAKLDEGYKESDNARLEKYNAYKKLKLVNNTLTVLLNNGDILSKSNATQEDFLKVKNSRSESEILDVMFNPEVREERRKQEKEIKRMQSLINGIETLKDVEDFVVDGNSVYLKGINRTLPQILVEEFIQIIQKTKMLHKLSFSSEVLVRMLDADEEYQSLKRFFMWCCLNPRAEVANELYRFLKENSFRITKQGFFVALRNVVTVEQDNELVKFVSNAYNKVKAVWKKSPDNYRVMENNGEYHLEKTTDAPKGTIVGNLTTLYLDLPNMAGNRFTDDWTKTFDIRLGKVVNMPQEDCNWSTQDCAAAGLHFTADQIHYVGCGDQSVLVLINPMKVVGIGEYKGRCYEYLPIMAVPRDEATEILHDLDFDTLELDEEYAIRELENLEEKAKQGFAAESTKYEFNLPQMSTHEIARIVKCLDEMKSEISNRVVDLD